MQSSWCRWPGLEMGVRGEARVKDHLLGANPCGRVQHPSACTVCV